jgi:hypothetical protein
MLLLYRAEEWRDALTADQLTELNREYTELHRELIESGVLVAGAPLRPTPTATTIRVRDDEAVVTDGPFAETKEQLGGFFLIEADSIDAARTWAAKVPAARHGSVEVRAVMPAPGEAEV